jgi:hypothetical protein
VQTPPEGLMRKRNIFAFDFCQEMCQSCFSLLHCSSPLITLKHVFLHGPNAAIQVEKTWENFMVALGLGT